VAFKYRMYTNKSWRDENFVGRKALNWWPGHAFASAGRADLIDASYVLLLQTNGDGEKKKLVEEKKHPPISLNGTM